MHGVMLEALNTINTAALLWLSFDLEMLGLVFKSLCMVYEKVSSSWTEKVEL